MAINPTYRDRVKYTLQHKDYGSVVITEPIGWQTDEKEYARNEKYHGIFAKFSNSLKFVDNGADFINFIRNVYGINADIRLIREEQHPHTDVWMRSYDGYLDLSTYETENGQVSVKFDASGLEKMLSSRESEKIEIERLDTMDGLPLPALVTKNVMLEGRRIFLKSIWDVEEANNTAVLYNFTRAGNQRGETIGVPLHLAVRSHENAESVVAGMAFGDNSYDRNGDGNASAMFILASNRVRRIRVKFDLSFRLYIKNPGNDQPDGGYDDIKWARFWVRLATYENGNSLNFKEKRDLFFKENQQILNYNNHVITLSFDDVIDLNVGESLSLQFTQVMEGRSSNNAYLKIQLLDIICNLSVEEDSSFEESNSKMILAKELGDRLINIITNNSNSLYSEILGRTDIGYETDGEASLTGFAHGHWLRNFDAEPISEDNKYKAFTTSFKDFMENLTVTWCLGLGIERTGQRERIRIEKQDYFYGNTVTVRLPNQVKKVKRSEAHKLYYSGLELGYAKGGDYEEAMGLDEYNVKSTFTTIINRVKNVYGQISKYRADAYGMEFARRKPHDNFATEDTSYDKDIFNLDLKRWFGDTFKQRKWQDDFEQEPTGIFSPETATNLRLSPFNILLRHGWVIASGLTKYLGDYIRYASSESNSNLTTKLIGGDLINENGSIRNGKLKRPRFVNEWIEFEHVVDFNIIQQIEGTTTNAFGKKIPNFYGLIEFVNENSELEKGYLFNLKPNGEGKWKLLKANR